MRSECFYVGALGSRRNHAKRTERLKEAGFSDAEIKRIHSPDRHQHRRPEPAGDRHLHHGRAGARLARAQGVQAGRRPARLKQRQRCQHPRSNCCSREARTMLEAYIYDGLRTPFGRHAGALSRVRPDDLLAGVVKEVVARSGFAPEIIDDVSVGCASQAGEDSRNVARHALLLAGLPVETPGAVHNRLCGSGLNALIGAAHAITCGEADVCIAGGVESMTRAPFVVGKAEQAFAKDFRVFDSSLGARFPNPKIETPVRRRHHAADRRQPRPRVPAEPRGVRCLRARLAAEIRQGGRRTASSRARSSPVSLPAGQGQARRRRRRRRASAPRDDHGELAEAQAPVRRRRDHGRQRLGHQRRRRRADRGEPRCRRQGGRQADCARDRHGGGRRAAAHHGLRPGAGGQEGAGARRPRRSRTWT